MTKNTNKGLAFALAVFTIVFSGVVRGQISDSPKKHADKVIAHAKMYLASDLNADMPQMTVDSWLHKVAGSRGQVKWQMVGCAPSDAVPKEDEPPSVSLLCVDASIHIKLEYFVHLSMEYGRFEPGVAPTLPNLRRIIVSDDYDGRAASVRSFREIPKMVRSLKRSLAFVDANHAQFTIAGKAPAGFEDLSLCFRTLEFGEYFAMKNTGEIETDDRKLYVLKNILFDGERLSFKTSVKRGVSYSFAGRFSRAVTNKNATVSFERKLLHGRLTKIIKGKRRVEAYLYFDLTVLGDFG